MKFDSMKTMALSTVLGVLMVAFTFLTSSLASDADETIEKIISGVESRYNIPGFSADFEQESILKAMDVTDKASGRLMVRQPGKMRWEYVTPEPQTIITDGNDLWIFRPEENQVMVGKSPFLFGEGKGAGFLSNIRSVRESFSISLEPSDTPDQYRLKLIPRKPSADLTAVELQISKALFEIVRITTFNVYGDETRIKLRNINRSEVPPEALFRFQAPEGADIVQMNP